MKILDYEMMFEQNDGPFILGVQAEDSLELKTFLIQSSNDLKQVLEANENCSTIIIDSEFSNLQYYWTYQ